MKNLIIFFIAILAASCSAKTGCPSQNYRNIQKHDAKPFRVLEMKPIGDGHWYVRAWRYREVRKMILECEPQIIDCKDGKYILL